MFGQLKCVMSREYRISAIKNLGGKLELCKFCFYFWVNASVQFKKKTLNPKYAMVLIGEVVPNRELWKHNRTSDRLINICA